MNSQTPKYHHIGELIRWNRCTFYIVKQILKKNLSCVVSPNMKSIYIWKIVFYLINILMNFSFFFFCTFIEDKYSIKEKLKYKQIFANNNNKKKRNDSLRIDKKKQKIFPLERNEFQKKKKKTSPVIFSTSFFLS